MKRFALFSFGVLCLMLAVAVGFHVGSQTAQAQPMETLYFVRPHGGTNGSAHVIAITPGGDIYSRAFDPSHQWQSTDPPNFNGNYWWGTAVPVRGSTWGGIKSQLDGKD